MTRQAARLFSVQPASVQDLAYELEITLFLLYS